MSQKFYLTASFAAAVVVIQLFVLFPSHTASQLDYSGCQTICDSNRGLGNKFAYEFDCDTVYTNTRDCRFHCRTCPDWICNISAPNIFNCPGTNDYNDYDECQDFCDENRPDDLPFAQNYNVTCYNKVHDLDWDIVYLNCTEKCQDCRRFCDDQVNDRLFYCPTQDFEWACKRDCDDNRQRLYGSDFRGAFSFSCDDHPNLDTQKCQDYCGLCPDGFCDPYVDKTTWHCADLGPDPGIIVPSTSSPTTPGPGEEAKYEENCKRRCDEHRIGVTQNYKLSCYITFPERYQETELSLCLKDCMRCSKSICEIVEDDGIFHCPPQESKVESEVESEMDSKAGMSRALIVFIAAISLIILAVIIFVVVRCIRNRNTGAANAVVPGSVVNPGAFQMSASPMISSTSYSSTGMGTSSSMVAYDKVQPWSPQGQWNHPVTVIPPNSQ